MSATEPVTAPRRASASIAVIGNPNSGKSTLFNALTGLRQKVANYPGVTVEKHVGWARLDGRQMRLVDLPGTYSLTAHSPDEAVAVDVLSGRMKDLGPVDAVAVVVDASAVRRSLVLASQILDLGVPVVVVLNMVDLARAEGVTVDAEELERRIGAPVVATVAAQGEGLGRLRSVLAAAVDAPARAISPAVPAVRRAAESLQSELSTRGLRWPVAQLERGLIDEGGAAERRLLLAAGDAVAARLCAIRREVGDGTTLAALEARAHYDRIDAWLDGVEHRAERKATAGRLDRVVNHPVVGTLLFVAVMTVVFQAVFSWATPLIDLVDAAVATLGGAVASVLPEGALSSLVVDGAIAGVGAVLVFLPQILILFAFVVVLEDSGYMARAAFLMDRLMRWCGLSGHSFIPMLSSCACAVPGIMAARVIGDRRDRIATIVAAPFMTCSARLPVYALLIAAFVPNRAVLGPLLRLQGLTLLTLYLLGVAAAVVTALALKRTALKGATPTFLMVLPAYRWPHLRTVAQRLLERAQVFVLRAGTVIFTVSLVIWAMSYFPRSPEVEARHDLLRAEAARSLDAPALERRLAEIDSREAAAMLEQSLLGRCGRLVEPLFRPLGWDWRISAAVVASFPAREVVIAALGTIYAVGDDVSEADQGLIERLRGATWPDGRRVVDVPVAMGILVFFALCLQCVSTMAIMRRETNSWRWPLAAWLYMTAAGWLGAWLTVHGLRSLGA